MKKFEIVKDWKEATHCFADGGLIAGPFTNPHYNVYGKTPVREIVEPAPSTDPLGAGNPTSEWLTKREQFAMAAMQGIMATDLKTMNGVATELKKPLVWVVAQSAKEAADALIAALQK